jgi:hypothetical protein
MNLWRHLLAHKRQPFYAFCEWYVFGRESNWGEAPAAVDVHTTDRACACVQISGPILSAKCDIHGPMKVVGVH